MMTKITLNQISLLYALLPNLLTKDATALQIWIIEIVSSGSRRMDYLVKLFKYRTSGVREYWIVDPEKNRILIYNFETEDTGDFTLEDTVKVGIYDDLSIDFSKLDF